MSAIRSGATALKPARGGWRSGVPSHRWRSRRRYSAMQPDGKPPKREGSSGMQDEQPAASAGERAAAAAAAAQDDAGGSDYAAPEVEGVAGDPMEDLLAEFVRRIELGEVNEETLQALQEMGILSVSRRRGGPPQGAAPLLQSFDLEGVAEYIKGGKAKKIIIMCGAGVSVSAGIPDFRSPGTGLYSQLARLNLPSPEAVFDMNYFRRNPKPFHLLAKELFPGNFAPTPAHVFMKLLLDKGLLLRVYTQNIDSLEHQAGLPQDRVVAAHGNFDSAHCIRCGREHSMDFVKGAVFADQICHCSACGGLVKPDIVFFGENLPDRFYDMAEIDFPRADLLIVLGTSLVVNPFASLIDCVKGNVPRLLINRERVGEQPSYQIIPGIGGGDGFDFDAGYRDTLFLGDCDDGVRRLADLLGWGPLFEEMIQAAGCSGAAGQGAERAAAAVDDIARKMKRDEDASQSEGAPPREASTNSSVDGASASATTEGGKL